MFKNDTSAPIDGSVKRLTVWKIINSTPQAGLNTSRCKQARVK